jgi:AcrR family transcriptional regulator
MARPPAFTDDQLLDGALSLLAAGGPGAATIAAISEVTGAPVGSIYHRFASRELLMARLWMRTVTAFQAGFIHALADDDPERAARDAIDHVIGWAGEHPAEMRVLVLHRREDLATRWPDELGRELVNIRQGLESAIRGHARARYGRDDDEAVARVTFALVDIPYAAVRRYVLTGGGMPAAVAEALVPTCRFALAARP